MKILNVAITLLLISCGKTAIDSGSQTNQGTAPININSDASSVSGPIGTSNFIQYSKIRSSTPCLEGRTRLIQDVTFHITGNFTPTKIQGNWSPGFTPASRAVIISYGISATHDLLMLAKMSDGSYSATLSLCSIPSSNPNLPNLVSNNRALINFQTPQGIMLEEQYGEYVLGSASDTIITSQKDFNDPNSFDFQVTLSFAKIKQN